jgi:tetratricopeptide (TPR) repeat protein
MTELSRPSTPPDADVALLAALRERDPRARLRRARAGLVENEHLDDETRVLLLRQIYLSEIALRRLRQASATAREMVEVGALREVALQDQARIALALGEIDEALGAQRLAVRASPPARRSFHLFSLATSQELAGDTTGAVRSLDRALRIAGRDRPLLAAYRGLLNLRRGRAVRSLPRLLHALERSPAREGYGRYVLGLLRAEMGDRRAAIVHLRAFLRRHANADAAQTLTLREELRRARVTLAAIDSDLD